MAGDGSQSLCRRQLSIKAIMHTESAWPVSGLVGQPSGGCTSASGAQSGQVMFATRSRSVVHTHASTERFVGPLAGVIVAARDVAREVCVSVR